VLELARRHSFVLPSFGLHPWYLEQRTDQWIDALNRHLDAVPSAVGEAGLDRWIPNAERALQEDVFLAQLRVAAERNLPLSIHCLKAWGRLVELLESHPLPERGFLLHSYGGPAEMIPRFARLGAFFSIAGYFAHDRKARQRDVFRSVPPDRLLIETDAPDMSPPDRLRVFSLGSDDDGRPINHPANIQSIYRFVATVLEQPLERLAAQVAENFHHLFQLNPTRRA